MNFFLIKAIKISYFEQNDFTANACFVCPDALNLQDLKRENDDRFQTGFQI